MESLHFHFGGLVLTPNGPRKEPPPELPVSAADAGSITQQFVEFLKEFGSFNTNAPLTDNNHIVIVSLTRVGLTAAYGFVSLAVPGQKPTAKTAVAMLPRLDKAEDESAVRTLRRIVQLQSIPDEFFFAPLAETEPLSVFYLPDDISAASPALFTFGKLLTAAFFSQLGVGQRE